MVEYTYQTYSDDVLSGKIKTCKWVKLSVQRYEQWKTRDDIYFDEQDVQKKIRFVAKMHHTDGQFNKKPFILLPWQQFVFANIFGWKRKSDNLRVTRNVLLFMSRKSGKTAFAAALSLVCSLIDGENGAEVDFVANNRQQAGIALRHAQNFARSLDPKQKVFKNYRSQIKVPSSDSILQVLSSDSMQNDGYSSSV